MTKETDFSTPEWNIEFTTIVIVGKYELSFGMDTMKINKILYHSRKFDEW